MTCESINQAPDVTASEAAKTRAALDVINHGSGDELLNLRDLKASGKNEDIDLRATAFNVEDLVALDLADATHHGDMCLGQGPVPGVGQQNALATQRKVGREPLAQGGVFHAPC